MKGGGKKISKDLVAVWSVPLSDGLHRIEFEHSTSTGKRVVRVDDKEVVRKGWVFNLVGQEIFYIGHLKCVINIETATVFSYLYTLTLDGRPIENYVELTRKMIKIWNVPIGAVSYVVCLEKDKLNVLVNGKLVDSKGEFVEGGTAINFLLSNHLCVIKSRKSTNKKEALIYELYMDEKKASEILY